VLRAGAKGSAGSEEALGVLCETYWYPLYAYARRRGASAEDARDLTQAFFTRLLAGDFLSRANPHRGRFRAFLLTAFKHFLANEHDYATARKRGGGIRPSSLDEAESRYLSEPAHLLTPEALYGRQWALTVIAETLNELEREADERGRSRQFEVLRPLLTENETSYRSAGAQLDMSEGAVRVAVHRWRRRFAERLRARIAETVDSPDDVDDELRYLQTLVAYPAGDTAGSL
jgi:RNA polymerase sigma-70 factor (ECF subfamily)